MALEFRPRDFMHPLGLWRFKRQFDKSQWLAAEQLEDLQRERRQSLLIHAAEHVPYYRRVLHELGADPRDFANKEAWLALPRLSPEMVRQLGPDLLAENREQYGPVPCTTSGTSGLRLDLLMDRPSNILEFCYYWRTWGWAGYRLGRPFAEFSSVHFGSRPERRGLSHQSFRMSRRLLLNSLYLDEERVRAHCAAVRRHGSRFLKGLPSVLSHFAEFVQKLGIDDLRFDAVFSQGETLTASEQRLIGETFRCPVHDSYGHMERTVAIATCEEGQRHAIPDYGYVEFEPQETRGVDGKDGTTIAAIIGTGLYNRAMPLVRYQSGDLVELPKAGDPCPCGRAFPRVGRILGRRSSALRTPGGRVVTAAFLVFEDFSTIVAGQISQPAPDLVQVRVLPAKGFDTKERKRLESRLSQLMGEGVTVATETVSSHGELNQDRAGESGKALGIKGAALA